MDTEGAYAAVLTVLLLSGCLDLILGGEEDVEVVEDDTDAFIQEYLAEQRVEEDAVQATTTTTTATTTTAAKIPCPHECCTGEQYRVKDCGEWFACVNHTCVDRPCPYECCVLGMYQLKECPGPIECVDYKCVRDECPAEYECCTDIYYKAKKCRTGYTCRENICHALDTDGDGLSDVAEENYGTDKRKKDTDGDGLTDYQEVKVTGTDPLDSNTDDDRYNDGVDSQPLTTDSAAVNVTLASVETTVNNDLIHRLKMYLDFNQAKPAAGEAVAAFETNIRVSNTGSDYTDGVNYTFRISRWCPPGVDVRRNTFVIDQYNENMTNTTGEPWSVGERGTLENSSLPTEWTLKDIPLKHAGKMDPGVRYIKHFTYSLSFGDLANTTWEAVAAERCTYNTSVVGIRYDRF